LTATDAPSTTTTGTESTATGDESEPSGPATTSEPTTPDSGDAPEPTETGDASEPSSTDSGDAPEPTETGTSDNGSPTETDGESASETSDEPTSGTEESASDTEEPASGTDEESAAEPASDSEEQSASEPATTTGDEPAAEEIQRRHARSFMVRRQDNTTSTDASDVSDSSSEDDEYTFDDDSDYVESFDNDVATAADLADDATGDYSDDPDNAAFTENTNKALQLASVQDSPKDANYTQLIDMSKTLAVIPSVNGNLYAATYSEALIQTNANLFGHYNGEIFGDDSGRFLHFHPDEMKVYSASRLRLSDDDSIPKTADFITLTLQQLDDSGNQEVYFAADTYGNLYNIVMCNFANSAVSKLFVVDGQKGLDALVENENVKYTVTGAPVQECYPLALIDAPSS
jgi:hypothetical protein